MLTLELDNDTERELNQLATQQQKPMAELVNDLIQNYLDDLHDAALADAAIDDLVSGKSTRVGFAEVKRQLNELDD